MAFISLRLALRRAGIAVFATMALGLASRVYGIVLPATVSIGNGLQQITGIYLNAQKLANNLAVTSVTVQATGSISIVDNSDLSTAITGTPKYNLTLYAPTLNVNNNLNMAAAGDLYLTDPTINLTATVTSGGSLIDPSRIISAATQVNVLAPTASIQQAIDFCSPSSPATVDVSAGQYVEDFSLNNSFNFECDNTGTAVTLGGTVGGSNGLNKTGAGALELTAANSYAGGTTINQGAFLVNNTTGSATGTGSVTVQTGGTLQGNGSVGGSIAVTGGEIYPGNGPGQTGILSTGSIDLTAPSTPSTAVFDLDGTMAGAGYDQLNVTGSVNLAGAALVIDPLGYVPSVGDTFTIINNDGTDAISGTFSGLPQGATFTENDPSGNSDTLQISYTGGTGNDVTLTVVAVPEPGCITLMCLSGTLLLRRRRIV